MQLFIEEQVAAHPFISMRDGKCGLIHHEIRLQLVQRSNGKEWGKHFQMYSWSSHPCVLSALVQFIQEMQVVHEKLRGLNKQRELCISGLSLRAEILV